MFWGITKPCLEIIALLSWVTMFSLNNRKMWGGNDNNDLHPTNSLIFLYDVILSVSALAYSGPASSERLGPQSMRNACITAINLNYNPIYYRFPHITSYWTGKMRHGSAPTNVEYFCNTRRQHAWCEHKTYLKPEGQPLNSQRTWQSEILKLNN